MLNAVTKKSIAYWDDADDLRWAVRHWASKINVNLAEIHLRLMTQKWASISTRGRLTLNTELLEVPRHLGEYVIVHELVHLLVPNHGKVFKSFMSAYMPDWEVCDDALKDYVAIAR
ncbi:hypothetical protein SAMN05216420_10159 [Nitrosospira sp. Nl5]|uniref:M48 metallopeptidase family protein n=1 Tax=Nitrosospira sp. Nl5 TaxID=200120 RepID=UPI000886C07B|nr:M48 family metallopeptidase [Nitrosospira sp. Nl5]SCX83860.1 hypothetical protein SAMN05216420_10159 [Nitrosospira sp. Nl5]